MIRTGFIKSLMAVALGAWMDEKGLAPDWLKEIDWSNFAVTSMTQDEVDRIEAPIGAFLSTLTKSEFLEGALRRLPAIPAYCCSTRYPFCCSIASSPCGPTTCAAPTTTKQGEERFRQASSCGIQLRLRSVMSEA